MLIKFNYHLRKNLFKLTLKNSGLVAVFLYCIATKRS